MLFGCEQPFLLGEERCVTSQQTAAEETIQVMTDIPVMGLNYSYPCNPPPITYQEGDGRKEAINNDNKEEAEKKRKNKDKEYRKLGSRESFSCVN